ncbi:MAG: three-Cys-motif partner protein TcmP [Candidatus Helarchaeota archaeon]
MCESPSNLIEIKDKTDEFKYNFLKNYIPLWNSIICGRGRRYRAIVETHAGTGYVILRGKKIYGSSLIFLEKTALKQEALDFHFIEKEKKHYKQLKASIEDIIKKGFFFQGIKEEKLIGDIKDGIPIAKSVWKYRPTTKYPKKNQIFLYNKDCKEAIQEILNKIENRPTFFFIDPCGKLDWSLIEYIINKRLLNKNGKVKLNEKGEKFQGTELFINFSWEAILRNNSNKFSDDRRNRFFLDVFGMTLSEIEQERKKIINKFKQEQIRYYEYNIYLEIFMNKLRNFFKFVSNVDIPGLKSIKNPIYCLIFCTNNESAENLFKNIEAKLNKKRDAYLAYKKLICNKKDFTIDDYNEIIRKNRLLDDWI